MKFNFIVTRFKQRRVALVFFGIWCRLISCINQTTGKVTAASAYYVNIGICNCSTFDRSMIHFLSVCTLAIQSVWFNSLPLLLQTDIFTAKLIQPPQQSLAIKKSIKSKEILALHAVLYLSIYLSIYPSIYLSIYLSVTLNADLEQKTHHQTPMTCTYTIWTKV